jgi:hypothetical protein
MLSSNSKSSQNRPETTPMYAIPEVKASFLIGNYDSISTIPALFV